ncbi:hypothetical protein TR70_4388 [Burkholderia pseudomallei]|nr:hypothetical protein TR70_4388 [Burkholderia pseudomallei]
MHTFVARCTAAGALPAAAALAHAQTSPSPDAVLRSAENARRRIDEGRFDDAGNDCAACVRSRPPSSASPPHAPAARAARRARAAGRVGSDIMLSRFTHATDLSDGLYANVDCTTARQRGNVVLEKRSLRQESDGRRRLVSYAPRRRRGVAPSLAGQ